MFTETILYLKNVLCSLLSFVLLTISCNGPKDKDSTSKDVAQTDNKYKNGYYCATVNYSNPNTGKSSTYSLTVEVNHGKVIKLLWPNGGWLDDSHFTPVKVDDTGTVSFTTDKGYKYKVQLDNFGECLVK